MVEQSAADSPPGGASQRPEPSLLRRALDPRVESTIRRRLERDLRTAVVQGGLVLYYQPRLSLTSGAIVAAEALLRWPHPRQGLISPGTFIPLAERTDLITDIGGFVLTAACAEAARWPASGAGIAPSVCVNVSARQLVESVLLEQLASALDASGLPAERLEIELDESIVATTSIETMLALSAVRDLGVGLTLDNFGTGYASLSILKRLPLTVMKLDRSLIRTLPDDTEEAALVQAVVAAGHALGLTVVAEGIETETQRAFLAGIGCDEGQGFLFSHPQPAAALATRLLFTTAT